MILESSDSCLLFKHQIIHRCFEETDSSLDTNMKDVAKGDVNKLSAHTRSLLYELNAEGETTMN
jgi:hypothetical protein